MSTIHSSWHYCHCTNFTQRSGKRKIQVSHQEDMKLLGAWIRSLDTELGYGAYQWKSGFSGKVHPTRLMMTLAA